MNASQLLRALDWATVNGQRAPDTRRVLSQESQALRAAIQSGESDRIGKAMREAERTLKLWEGR